METHLPTTQTLTVQTSSGKEFKISLASEDADKVLNRFYARCDGEYLVTVTDLNTKKVYDLYRTRIVGSVSGIKAKISRSFVVDVKLQGGLIYYVPVNSKHLPFQAKEPANGAIGDENYFQILTAQRSSDGKTNFQIRAIISPSFGFEVLGLN